jgi:hypothetical protein
MDLVANKSFPYKGRNLRAGVRFSAPNHDARLLLLTRIASRAPAEVSAKPVKPARKAKPVEAAPVVAPEPELVDVEPAVENAEQEDATADSEVSADDLRTVAEALGVTVDGRWGAARLQEEIDRARQTYSTRVMRAND